MTMTMIIIIIIIIIIITCHITVHCIFMVLPTSEEYANFLQNSVIQLPIFTFYIFDHPRGLVVRVS